MSISNKANYSRMQLIKSVTFARSWTSGKFWVRKRMCSCCGKLMTQEVSVSVCSEPWCQESGAGMRSGQTDGTHCETVAGKREANLRASSNSLPFRAWMHVMRALSVSKLQNFSTRKNTFACCGQESSLFLFVCIAVLSQSKPEQNPRARTSIFAAFMFLSESNRILVLQHKNKNVLLYYSSFLPRDRFFSDSDICSCQLLLKSFTRGQCWISFNMFWICWLFQR